MIFKKQKYTFTLTFATCLCASAFSQTNTLIKNIDQHLGNTVKVCGTILSIKNLENVKNKPILINLGGNDVSEHLDVVIGTGDSSLFSFKKDSLIYKTACITGIPFYFKGGKEFTYLKAENIEVGGKEIAASAVFQQQTIQELNTGNLGEATHDRSLKRVIVFYKGLQEPQKKRLLTKYLKAGQLLSYMETGKKKTYVVLLKNYMDE